MTYNEIIDSACNRILEQKGMTNQEYIATLSPAEFWAKIQWLQKDYGKRYTDSYPAIIEWLSAESEDKECR